MLRDQAPISAACKFRMHANFSESASAHVAIRSSGYKGSACYRDRYRFIILRSFKKQTSFPSLWLIQVVLITADKFVFHRRQVSGVISCASIKDPAGCLPAIKLRKLEPAFLNTVLPFSSTAYFNSDCVRGPVIDVADRQDPSSDYVVCLFLTSQEPHVSCKRLFFSLKMRDYCFC